jgi:hypothetical protein
MACLNTRSNQKALSSSTLNPPLSVPTHLCHITPLLSEGLHPLYVAHQRGHSTLAMVVRHYARWTRKPDRNGAERPDTRLPRRDLSAENARNLPENGGFRPWAPKSASIAVAPARFLVFNLPISAVPMERPPVRKKSCEANRLNWHSFVVRCACVCANL